MDLNSEIEKIISNNCKEIEYEGTEVHRGDMRRELIEFINKNFKEK